MRVRAVPAHHPLAGARNEENRFVLTGADGSEHALFGKGAGRWPTAAAVFADIMDIHRGLSEPDAVDFAASVPARAPALLRA